jgi:hypothetical protein
MIPQQPGYITDKKGKLAAGVARAHRASIPWGESTDKIS